MDPFKAAEYSKDEGAYNRWRNDAALAAKRADMSQRGRVAANAVYERLGLPKAKTAGEMWQMVDDRYDQSLGRYHDFMTEYKDAQGKGGKGDLLDYNYSNPQFEQMARAMVDNPRKPSLRSRGITRGFVPALQG